MPAGTCKVVLLSFGLSLLRLATACCEESQTSQPQQKPGKSAIVQAIEAAKEEESNDDIRAIIKHYDLLDRSGKLSDLKKSNGGDIQHAQKSILFIEEKLRESAALLDDIDKEVEEYGQINVSAPLISRRSPDLKFDLNNDAEFYFKQNRLEGASSLSVLTASSTGIGADIRANPIDGVFPSNTSQLPGQITLAETQLTSAEIEKQNGKVTEAATKVDTERTNLNGKSDALGEAKKGVANASPNDKDFPDKQAKLEKAQWDYDNQELVFKAAVQNYATQTGLLQRFVAGARQGQLQTLQKDPTLDLSPRQKILNASGDKMTQDILKWVSYPQDIGDNKVAFMCLLMISCHPGTRTFRDYAAEVTVKVDYARAKHERQISAALKARNILDTNDMASLLIQKPLLEEYLKALKIELSDKNRANAPTKVNLFENFEKFTKSPQNVNKQDALEDLNAFLRKNQGDIAFASYEKGSKPLVAAAFPMLDSQVLNLRFSLREQMQFAAQLAGATQSANAKIQGQLLQQFFKRIEQDVETQSVLTLCNATSHGGHTFGFRVAPHLMAQNTPGSKGAKPELILRAGTFPSMVVIVCDKSDLSEDIWKEDRTGSDQTDIGVYNFLAFHIESRWTRISDPARSSGMFGRWKDVMLRPRVDEKRWYERVDRLDQVFNNLYDVERILGVDGASRTGYDAEGRPNENYNPIVRFRSRFDDLRRRAQTVSSIGKGNTVYQELPAYTADFSPLSELSAESITPEKVVAGKSNLIFLNGNGFSGKKFRILQGDAKGIPTGSAENPGLVVNDHVAAFNVAAINSSGTLIIQISRDSSWKTLRAFPAPTTLSATETGVAAEFVSGHIRRDKLGAAFELKLYGPVKEDEVEKAKSALTKLVVTPNAAVPVELFPAKREAPPAALTFTAQPSVLLVGDFNHGKPRYTANCLLFSNKKVNLESTAELSVSEKGQQETKISALEPNAAKVVTLTFSIPETKCFILASTEDKKEVATALIELVNPTPNDRNFEVKYESAQVLTADLTKATFRFELKTTDNNPIKLTSKKDNVGFTLPEPAKIGELRAGSYELTIVEKNKKNLDDVILSFEGTLPPVTHWDLHVTVKKQ